MPKRERDALAQVPLFQPLAPRHLRRIADLMREERIMEDGAVVTEGEEGDTFYVILEGEAKVQSRSGRVMNRLRPGDFFGEVSLLDGGPRTASVYAETPMTVLTLARASFLKMVRDEPQIAVKLLSHIASLLRRLERSPSG